MKPISITIILFFLIANLCFAIDNPDTSDYVGEFEKRIAPLEKYITQGAKTTLDVDQGYVKLERALDQELNAAYKLLISKLDSKEKESMKSSQIQWLKFRDTEFKWIIENWDNKKFGSSAAISRGQYRTTIIRERVMHLLNYLKNY
jgi:uncharacterized protein YecT (DUF1311 family)